MKKAARSLSALLLGLSLGGCGGSSASGGGGMLASTTAASTSAASSAPVGSSSAPTGSGSGPVGSTPGLAPRAAGGSSTAATGASATSAAPPSTSAAAPSGASASTHVGNGPTIAVTAPARGAQLAAGAFTVEGTVASASGIALVTVDGTPVNVGPGGAFAQSVTLVPGQNVIHVVATDAQGQEDDASIGVLAGTFLPPGSEVPNAAAARVTNDAFAKVAPVIDAALLEKLKGFKGAQVGTWSVSVLGHTIKTDVSVADVSVGSAAVSLQAAPSGLDASLQAKSVAFDLVVSVDAGSFLGQKLGFTDHLDLSFAQVCAQGTVALAVQGGQLGVDTSGLSLGYSPTVVSQIVGQGALNAINGALGAIGKIFGASVTFDEVGLVNKVLDMVWQGGLKSTADTEIAKAIVQKGVSGISLPVGGATATLTYAVEKVATDAQGLDLTNGMGCALSGPDAYSSLGSLVTAGTPPSLAATSGVELALNQDALDQVLEVAWRKGMLDRDFREVSSGTGQFPSLSSLSFSAKDLSLLIPALDAIIPAGAGLDLQLTTKAAPVLTLAAGGKGTLALTEAEVTIGIVLPGSTVLPLLTVATNATAPVSFSVDAAAATLSLSAGKPTFVFDLTSCVVSGIPKTLVESVLELILPPIVDFAGSKLLGPIPLPAVSIQGVTPSLESLGTAGSVDSFLDADLSLN